PLTTCSITKSVLPSPGSFFGLVSLPTRIYLAVAASWEIVTIHSVPWEKPHAAARGVCNNTTRHALSRVTLRSSMTHLLLESGGIIPSRRAQTQAASEPQLDAEGEPLGPEVAVPQHSRGPGRAALQPRRCRHKRDGGALPGVDGAV